MFVDFLRGFLKGNSIHLYKKKEYRYLIKGFNYKKKNSNLSFIQNIKSELINTPTSKFTLDEVSKMPEEICLQQFLNYRILNFNFTKNLLIVQYKKGHRIKSPLPYMWRKKIKEKGYLISYRSILNWELFKFLWLWVGLFYGLKKIFQFFIFKKFPKEFYAHLYGVNKTGFLNKEKDNLFFNWLKNQEEISCLKHLSLKQKIKRNNSPKDFIKYVDDDLPSIEGFYNLSIFILWLFKVFCEGLIKSDVYNLIFLERVKRKIVSLSSKENLANVYLFNNEHALFRPLWTYEKNIKNFEIILFFYSKNNSSLKFNKKKHVQQFNWELSNWPIYWIWDKYQDVFLKQNCKHIFDTFVKGPLPYFDTNNQKSFKVDSASIIIFDVQPVRESIYPLFGIHNHYYSTETSKIFFDDIIKIASELQIKVFFKRKRNSKHTPKEYLSFLNKLKDENVEELKPNLSPFHLLKSNDFLISINMPYTSTANISHFFMRPTIFYDPLKTLDSKFYARGDIKMIQSKQELKKWIIEQKSFLNSKIVI